MNERLRAESVQSRRYGGAGATVIRCPARTWPVRPRGSTTALPGSSGIAGARQHNDLGDHAVEIGVNRDSAGLSRRGACCIGLCGDRCARQGTTQRRPQRARDAADRSGPRPDVHQCIDTVGDPLRRLPELLHRPVGGVAAVTSPGRAWLTSRLVSERGRMTLALDHRAEAVAKGLKPELRAAGVRDPDMEMLNLRDMPRPDERRRKHPRSKTVRQAPAFLAASFENRGKPPGSVSTSRNQRPLHSFFSTCPPTVSSLPNRR